MKKLIPLLSLSFFFVNATFWEVQSQISGIKEANPSYTDYRELQSFNDYEKVSDTAFAVSGYEDTHRVTHLRKNDTTTILFSEISLDDNRKQHYRLLDTLKLTDIQKSQYVTIGYCYKEGLHEQQIIGLVERTEGMNIENLVRAWKADTGIGAIEELKALEGIQCLNEFSGQ